MHKILSIFSIGCTFFGLMISTANATTYETYSVSEWAMKEEYTQKDNCIGWKNSGVKRRFYFCGAVPDKKSDQKCGYSRVEGSTVSQSMETDDIVKVHSKKSGYARPNGYNAGNSNAGDFDSSIGHDFYTKGGTTAAFICCNGTMKKCTNIECTTGNKVKTHYDDICQQQSSFMSPATDRRDGTRKKGDLVNCAASLASGIAVPGYKEATVSLCGTDNGVTWHADIENCNSPNVIRGATCAAPCLNGQMYEGPGSAVCTSKCEITNYSGPGKEQSGVDVHGDPTYQTYMSCLQCTPGLQFYNKKQQKCLDKDKFTEVQRKRLKDCWQCNDSQMKTCLTGKGDNSICNLKNGNSSQ